MKLPVIEAGSVLDGLGWLEGVYYNTLPEDIKADPSKTIVLLTEVENTPDEWGNDDFNSLSQSVELEIFYGDNFNQNIQDLEIDLMNLYQKAGWKIATSRPHMTDPDTNQVIKVFYFSKKNQL